MSALALRRQVAEIPPIQPHVTEYRLHTLTCRRCGGRTAGEPPPGTPAGAFGPRLSAMVGLLSGVYRPGKRPVRQLLADLFGLSISTGMICKLQRRAAAVLTPAYDELCRVAERTVRHGVLWRKTSGGTDSATGSRFVGRILSVVATCRQQGRNVWDYLTDCHRAALAGHHAPSLLPTQATGHHVA